MPKRYRVQITAAAEDDVRRIVETIRADNVRAANQWRVDFGRKLRSLSFLPERFELIPEAEELRIDCRHLLFGNYRILYRVESNRVAIVRLIHAARILHERYFAVDSSESE